MPEPVDWSYYRSLLAVLRHGSLSAAARELGLTQPTLGRHIDALEAEAGTSLFLRSQNGLLPTATALQMRAQAEVMEAAVATLRRTATQLPGEVSGTVRITASEVIGIEVLPAIIARLQDDHPALAFELSITDDTEDLLRQRADIAVRMVAPTQEALISRHIGAIPIGLYAHRRYLEKHGMPASLADLRHHRLIGYDRKLAYVRAVIAEHPELENFEFSLRTDSNLEQLALVRAGAGIGLCQCALAKREPDLLPLLQKEVRISLPTYVAMHEAMRQSPRCRVVFDGLVDGLLEHVRGSVEQRN